MRMKKKWTQGYLCQKAKISLGTVRGFEEGRTSKLSDKVLFKLSSAFGLTPIEFEKRLGSTQWQK